MRSKYWTYENGLYVLALLLAVLVRMIHLGQQTLTDNEAVWALQALDLATGKKLMLGPQPGYILLTSLFFSLLGSGNFLARFIPALSGSLFVLAPLAFRKYIGKIPAVVLAFVLVFDPGLAAISKQANGSAIALVFLILAFGLILLKKPIAAGICAGLALLGGPSVWHGILVLGITLGWMFITSKRGAAAEETEKTVDKIPWKEMLPWLAGTFIVVGSLLFTTPSGLSAAAQSLVEFLKGGDRSSPVSLSTLLIVMPAYTPLALVFGIWGLVWGWIKRETTEVFLSRWFFVALVFALVYPGRQVTDLVWATLPLWVLAVRQFCRVFRIPEEAWVIPVGEGLLAFILLAFAWMNFIAEVNPNPGDSSANLRLVTLVGSLVLLLLVTALVAFGWSIRLAAMGLLFGCTFILVIFNLGAGFKAAGFTSYPADELWRSGPYIQDADLLTRTVGDLSEWNVRSRQGIDIVATDSTSPALRWALRGFPNLRFVDSLANGETPSLVITTSDKKLALTASYSGQDFIWESSVPWDILFPSEWLHWIGMHTAPAQTQAIILWARVDLFPGATKPSPVKTNSLTPQQ